MEITLTLLDKQLGDFKEQHKNLVAQANAVSGAIQAIELLISKLNEPEQIPIPFPTPPPIGTIPTAPTTIES